MHIISERVLKEYGKANHLAKQPLADWIVLVKNEKWEKPSDVILFDNAADVLKNNRICFDIGGNKFRLIVKVEYKFGDVYIKFIGTHKEYDRIDANTIEMNY